MVATRPRNTLRWEDAELTKNGCVLLQNTHPSSDEHRVLKALLAKTLGHEKLLSNGVGSTKSLPTAYRDFESMKSHRRLDAHKKYPSSKSETSDEAMKSCAGAIASRCSTTARPMRGHCIRLLSTALVSADIEENGNNELVHLPDLRRKTSKVEMFDECKASVESNVLERAPLCSVVHRLTRTQDRSLRALDCNITGVHHEPKERPSTIIESFSAPENLAAVNLLQIDFDLLCNAVQHHHLFLIATSTSPQHVIKFAFGDSTTTESKSSLSEIITRFFKE